MFSHLSASADFSTVVLARAFVAQLDQSVHCLGYVGPGAGLTMMGALLAVAGILLLALLAPILYPLRAIMMLFRNRGGASATDNSGVVGPNRSTTDSEADMVTTNTLESGRADRSC